ncbi:hypothetical protein J5N97_001444 [Dioscorea zingiberensis]|uniref:Cationic amino acid transporter C-terminal domain-containing protein n=1 Tax=Dioscorea zingiberensis TaxID=325984 RepID=A0A9D5BU44_9LILI|nr:hypothetical protein J5N97_001444 [Dioscorea zingiberensis]
MALFVPQEKRPRVWGVPLVPWLPSVSIASNVFLVGSLHYQAFVRFGVCTAVMLRYYVLFGVHATYDVAHEEELDGAKVDVVCSNGGGGVVDFFPLEINLEKAVLESQRMVLGFLILIRL